MVLNNFRFNIVARIALIGVLLAGMVYCAFIAHWIITPFILLVITCAATAELIFYVEKTNREVTDFLLSVKNSDFTKYNNTDRRGKSFSELREGFNTILDEFQAVRIDKEANYTFLQAVVEHLDTAIIAFDDAGEINLINEAAKNLLHLPYLKNIHSLKKTEPMLCQYLMGLRPGSNPIFETDRGDEKQKLLGRSTIFKIQGTGHKVISIQNIKAEIEHTEIEAWEQLLHVLTHEIMNSITPISSLSGTLRNKMDHLAKDAILDPEVVDDISMGLQVIENRSLGLVSFVNNYKSLITLPAPVFQPISVNELFERVRLLTEKQLGDNGITLLISAARVTRPLCIDISLIEQTLLNLINNAVDALAYSTTPVIHLSAEERNGSITIGVRDNGAGIDREAVSKIFIPFYTTKKNGSGIGLSLSRQIMRTHKGSISVSSSVGSGSVFSLEFPGN